MEPVFQVFESKQVRSILGLRLLRYKTGNLYYAGNLLVPGTQSYASLLLVGSLELGTALALLGLG